MRCTSLLLKGRENCELFYAEVLEPMFDHQLPPLDLLYALFLMRTNSWQHPSSWHIEVYQIIPMQPLIIEEKDQEFRWLFILQSAEERVEVDVLIQTDSTDPHCYTHFISSLQLIFPPQGSRTQATPCIQELKSMLQRHDISLEGIDCTTEGWAEDTTFHPLIEHDLGKLRWNAALNQFMHPLER